MPTHKPMIRTDFPDVIYKTRKEKYEAAIEEIISLHKKGQPVLVGTISIDVSEQIAKNLKKRGIPTTCSTPRTTRPKPRSSAMPVRKGAVTISTNMAGRGTDIKFWARA
jgi:preprotein translocase subunit SecA